MAQGKNAVAKIIEEARKADLRRQEQISRQSKIIDRLLTENQMMIGLIGEIAALDSDELGYRSRSQEILDNIERLREQARKQDEKRSRKNGN